MYPFYFLLKKYPAIHETLVSPHYNCLSVMPDGYGATWLDLDHRTFKTEISSDKEKATSIAVVQLLSCVRLIATPWTEAPQAPLSFPVPLFLVTLARNARVSPLSPFLLPSSPMVNYRSLGFKKFHLLSSNFYNRAIEELEPIYERNLFFTKYMLNYHHFSHLGDLCSTVMEGGR